MRILEINSDTHNVVGKGFIKRIRDKFALKLPDDDDDDDTRTLVSFISK